ncbi:hypothetical protein EUX98_g7136 [Antrodiella citrinella]|uniref:2',3'-cyclic-nucleotide 3'-phosphodiesterase n=1 Tax=Antrodiella citrinella TaxID=2447956 RepID=A0A4S4MM94_9APHY|nr:hypothetical protein EUX98_g7136 [Antrodiella citrinella]
MGTSLWLVPDFETESPRLERIMSQKTDTAKSPSSFPHFHPHVTLATVPSSTPESVLRSAIAASQPRVPVKFRSVDVGDKYFMSVYVTAQRTPELVQLREHLSKTLGDKTVPPVAHLSLFYIDDSDVAERVKIAASLREQGRVIDGPERGSVQLDCTEGDARGEDLLGGIAGHEIWIMECDGPVETWRRLGDRIVL